MAHALRFVVSLALATAAAGAVVARAQDLEYQVKAGFLYNFLTFIEWDPAQAPRSDPFRVCVIGNDPFGRTLDELMQGERVGDRPIVVARPVNEEAAGGCQVVFVARTDDMRLPTVVRHAAGKGVLVVAETPRALATCAAISFVQDGERLRFDVNMNVLRRQGLRASSKLLRVARDVSDRYTGCDRK